MWTLAPGLSWVAGTIPPTMLTYPTSTPLPCSWAPRHSLVRHHVSGGVWLFMFLGTRRLRHEPFFPSPAPAPGRARMSRTFFSLGVVGVVIGGRLGYCLFYKPGYYPTHPLEIFAVWQGGMAFGGLLGVIAAMLWFAHSRKRPGCRWLILWRLRAHWPGCRPWVTSSTANCGGRFASPDLPWGMQVCAQRFAAAAPPFAGLPVLAGRAAAVRAAVAVCPARAQTGRWPPPSWSGYGSFRFIAEYFREPDSFLGLLSLGMSMGQWLCVPMVAAGMALWGGRSASRWLHAVKPRVVRFPGSGLVSWGRCPPGAFGALKSLGSQCQQRTLLAVVWPARVAALAVQPAAHRPPS